MNWLRKIVARLVSGAGILSVAVSCTSVTSRPNAIVVNPNPTWTNSLPMIFVRLPAGEFVEGSPLAEPERSTNETPHHATITRSFWPAATHVTVGQFTTFVNASGYRTAAEQLGWANGSWNVAEKQ